jgi:hypothetical protein
MNDPKDELLKECLNFIALKDEMFYNVMMQRYEAINEIQSREPHLDYDEDGDDFEDDDFEHVQWDDF